MAKHRAKHRDETTESTIEQETLPEEPSKAQEQGPAEAPSRAEAEVAETAEGQPGPKEETQHPPPEALLEEVERLRSELEQARAEAAEYKDRWLRSVAEMDNMRKRLEKRYTEEAEREKRRFLRAILPLVDHLEMVLRHSDSDPEVLRQGVEMIYQELMRTLEGEGLKPIESVGKPFDPFVHEAVEVVKSEEHPENVVVDEVQRGYLYKGELLRPARVRVAKKQAEQEEVAQQ